MSLRTPCRRSFNAAMSRARMIGIAANRVVAVLFPRTTGGRVAGRFAEALESRQLLSGSVVINEIHYDPDIKTEQVEFIELTNPGDAPVDLGGATFSSGVGYTFPQGTVLPPGGFVVVTQNSAEFRKKFGFDALGQFTGGLSNDGEQLTLRDAAGNKLDEVTYGAGFPWPTVGDAPGYSIELINPTFDNNLGGNWRSTSAGVSTSSNFIAANSNWDYRKGTSDASDPISAWRQPGFQEDGSWATGATPIGYDSALPMGTSLSDMPGNYSSFYLRKTFSVDDPSSLSTLQLDAMYDDGFNVWINGHLAQSVNAPGENAGHDATALSTIEDSSFKTYQLDPTFLTPGQNVIAVQVFNVLLSNSSDAFFDARLTAKSGQGVGPTPGRRNASFATNAAPQMRQVSNTPQQPAADQPVTITAKITDPQGVASAKVTYQVVEPGNYIALEDPAYNDPANWTSINMNDAGTDGDAVAGDNIYSAVIPASVQQNRRLVRYRISTADTAGASITAPYQDDPTPNFAYYVYNGVPTWTGAAKPGAAGTLGTQVTYPSENLTKVPVYQLLTKRQDHVNSQHIPGATTGEYQGDNYLWSGAMVYDGVVYDHIHYRSRGGVWRYAMGKNMWKFEFNNGHEFQARDAYGNPYPVKWSKLNLGANIQQGDIGKRGEQGLFESLGFSLFNLAGVPASNTTPVHFRIVENASETGSTSSQYDDDFQGMYLAVEQDNGRFLDAHGLPDGNFYKMETGSGPGGGTLNNQGPTQPNDNSDLVAFRSGLNANTSDQWIRDNIDLDEYYSYHAIVEMIHHYDIGFGKNYFFYHNPQTGKWSQVPWDLDLTWYVDYEPGGGQNDPFTFILSRPTFQAEYRSRVREIRDLLYNNEQVAKLADAYAAIVNPPGGKSIVEADRAMWDYNPILASGFVNPSKAGQGRFYQSGTTATFAGMVQKLKSWAASRATFIDNSIITSSDENAAPRRPTVTYSGPADHPANELTFSTSNFAPGIGGSGFSEMEWRLADVTPVSGRTPNYEIKSVWESGVLAQYSPTIKIPTSAVIPGHTYRVRVRMKALDGRWSHWSSITANVSEFVASAASSAAGRSLRVTELNYHPASPAAGSPYGSDDFEFIEFKNFGAEPLNLKGVSFASGIDFTFGDVTLAPGEVGVVVKDPDAFASRYSNRVRILGDYSGNTTNFSNGGERILIVDADAQPIQDFTYDDAWYPSTDGEGPTLVVNAPAGLPDLSVASNWHASTSISGTPGTDETAPIISGLVVGSTNWGGEFLTYLQSGGVAGGFTLPSTGAATVPWSNINRVGVTFSAPVAVEEADLTIKGIASTYPTTGFSYDALTRTAVWTLAQPLPADRIQLLFGGAADADGHPFTVDTASLRVLPGDVNRDGITNATDLVLVRNRIGRTVGSPGSGAAAYSPFADVDGSGTISATDVVLVRNRIGTSLPPPPGLFSDFRLNPRRRTLLAAELV